MPKDYLTVVLQLPDDPDGRAAVSEALRVGGTFNGATITAVSLEDEITVNEILEEQMDSDEVDDARAHAKRRNAVAERLADNEGS
ncbi:hypothetical protein BLA39750_01115 [Burkholderia lata]|uniref:Uncharacterized protein n=1 Tax=Burkholderia lata (strain ATCC 17760 / DSM 23089 / LMG 22485 / NCIMB 9086 / R18194 / 383) TaxID=482957 RepID=A0A6P2URR0_BURL3|nr:hypothetical protein [Burkholderia lata]VWC79875.1 hypothetical protein BLA39750_01115 [Burkholderia lata]